MQGSSGSGDSSPGLRHSSSHHALLSASGTASNLNNSTNIRKSDSSDALSSLASGRHSHHHHRNESGTALTLSPFNFIQKHKKAASTDSLVSDPVVLPHLISS
jgi:hypothetical protein